MFEPFFKDLLKFLVRRTGSVHDAADLAQEAMLRAHRYALHGVVAQPKAFLFRTAEHLSVDHFRSEALRSAVESPADADALETSVSGAPRPDEQVESSARFEAFRRAVGELPPRCREVFLLHKFEGFSHAEIAARFGIQRNTVEQHMIKALSH